MVPPAAAHTLKKRRAHKGCTFGFGAVLGAAGASGIPAACPVSRHTRKTENSPGLPTDGVCDTNLSGATLEDILVEESGLGITVKDVEDYYKALPEPTVLALLALGVALRRRAA